MRAKAVLLLTLVALVALICFSWVCLAEENKKTEQKLEQLKEEKHQLEQDIEELRMELEIRKELNEKYKNDVEELVDKIEDFLDAWEVEVMEITGYAPLDEDAIPGFSYEGDPEVTYLGEAPVPGETAAGPKDMLGETVFVRGLGLRRINDIGEDVGSGRLDLVFESRAAALRFGRQSKKVLVKGE